MKIVVAKKEKRAREEGKDTVFFHHGSLIPSEKIENFKRRRTVKYSDPASPNAGKYPSSFLLASLAAVLMR